MKMANEYADDVYREMYFAEHDRRENLNQTLALPAAIATVLCSVVGYYLQSVDFGAVKWGIWEHLFIVFGVLLAVTNILAVVFLVRAFWNYKYGYIASAQKIAEYASKLRGYYVEIEAQDIDELVENDLRESLREQFIKYAENNSLNNDQKSRFLYLANSFLVAALIFLVLSTFPYYKTQDAAPCIPKVKIATP